jgi:hypothetical protein
MFAPPKHGSVAEWLGRGLQNLVQRFESARYLHLPGPDPYKRSGLFVFLEYCYFLSRPAASSGVRIFTFSLK